MKRKTVAKRSVSGREIKFLLSVRGPESQKLFVVGTLCDKQQSSYLLISFSLNEQPEVIAHCSKFVDFCDNSRVNFVDFCDESSVNFIDFCDNSSVNFVDFCDNQEHEVIDRFL